MIDDDCWLRVEAALSSGKLLGVPPDELERHETHLSVVVLFGDVVYKLKKPVVFDFADYGTADRRRTMCEAELRLNRRLAPRLYLGLAAVVEDGPQLRLAEGPVDDALEHLVMMQRVDPRSLLDARLSTEDTPPEALRDVGRAIARFHADAAPAPGNAWSPERISRDLSKRFDYLRLRLDSSLELVALETIGAFLDRWLAAAAPILSERAAAGWVRDGHGDLRAEHVVIAEPVQVIDCVEFSDYLRCADVLSDFAFLVMELEYAERSDLSRALRDAWSEAGGPLDDSLLWPYASMRALIRVEVALRRAEQLHDDELRRSLILEHAHRLLELSEQLTWRVRRPTAILVGGLSGTGKSTIAQSLARRAGLQHVSSDAVRKATLGLRVSEIAPPQAYAPAVSLRVYEQLGKAAGEALGRGRSTVVDATFRREADCQAFQLGLARATSEASNVVSLGLTAEPQILRERISTRRRKGGSDATLDVLERQLAESPWRLPVYPETIPVSTDGTFAEALREIDSLLLDRTLW